jgi:hypothetical protein
VYVAVNNKYKMESYKANQIAAQAAIQKAENVKSKMDERLKYVHATIQNEAQRGRDRVKFESGELDGQDVDYLRRQGYLVESCSGDLMPEFRVVW